MTGYTVHTGSSEDFISGWDRIFGDEKSQESGPKSKARKSEKGSKAKSPKAKKKPGKKSKKK